MRSILKALVGFSLLVAGAAHAQPNQFGAGGGKVVVPTVTSDAYTIPGDYATGDVILSNTGDTDADVWTLPECDSAISMGDATYGPKYSTVGMVVQVFVNTAILNSIVLDPQATDQIAGLTSAVNVNLTSVGKGAFAKLTCAADDLWVFDGEGFVGDGAASSVAYPIRTTPIDAVGGETLTVPQIVAAGGLVTNSTDANGAIVTLPGCTAATLGLRLTFYSSIVTQVFNINPNALDDFQGIETTNAAGDSLENTTTPVIGDSISFYCKTATHWYVDQESTADWVDAN